MSFIMLWKDQVSGQASFVSFDVVSEESIASVMAITEHPVEEGANVVDHARPQNIKINVEGYVSNKPLYSNTGVEKLSSYQGVDLTVPLPKRGLRPARRKLDLPTPPLKPNVAALVGAGIDAIKGAITGGTFIDLAPEDKPDASAIKVTALQPDGEFPDRARAMWETLYFVQQARQLVSVSIKLALIDNMLIESLEGPRTIEDGSGASFRLSLTQIRIAKPIQNATPKNWLGTR